MNEYDMIAFSVLVITLGIVLSVWINRGGARRARHAQSESDNRLLRDDLVRVKDRLAVLERIATDKDARLEQEIERLRSD
jgi:hypothetical protein